MLAASRLSQRQQRPDGCGTQLLLSPLLALSLSARGPPPVLRAKAALRTATAHPANPEHTHTPPPSLPRRRRPLPPSSCLLPMMTLLTSTGRRPPNSPGR
eukprot:scaffold227836_cov32-Tisochrysis_lutea.AAC.1